ncbi:hypothetical protein ElyMa_003225600 [Elysia marginata]|uniref:Apple domain-containing protein n=1 Tax=Elysia marginata TaxID=1093978 RepID=A0AAV4J4M7_9GAST|nr:hypothetical protein ElyMa_003225600 [Elysia marginata]
MGLYFWYVPITDRPVSRTNLVALTVLLTLFQLELCAGQASVDAESQSSFKIVPGKRLSSGVTEIETVVREGLTLQQCAILCKVECGMFDFSASFNVCTTFRERNYDYGIQLSLDTGWTWAYKRRHTTITNEGWTLVFRAQAKTSVSAYNTWTDPQATTDNPVEDSFPHACLRLEYYTSCDRHFRSHVIDSWVNIDKARSAAPKLMPDML